MDDLDPAGLELLMDGLNVLRPGGDNVRIIFSAIQVADRLYSLILAYISSGSEISTFPDENLAKIGQN